MHARCSRLRVTFQTQHHGFAFCRHTLEREIVENAERLEKFYLSEMEALLLREVEDVDQVYFFDWRIRKNITINQSIIDANDKIQHLLPAQHVHLDQAPSAAIGRVKLHLPEDANYLLQGRVRFINVWRPLVDVVQDRPLAIYDMRTISPDDLVEADHVRKQYNGSNYYAKPSINYKWYYLNQQTKDEVTLLQIFDSEKDGEVSGSLHTSFDHVKQVEAAVPRQSVEVRALVFTYAP